MTFSTPPSTPTRTSFHTPTTTDPSTPFAGQTLRTPVRQSACALAENLLEAVGSNVVPHPTTPSPVGTPGRISNIRDLHNRQNTIHVFPKGHIVYRGDNSFNPAKAHGYQPQFFTPEQDVAKSQYGELVLKFTSTREIKLLRLDKNAEGFHDWLKNTAHFADSDKQILHKNFGYPKNSPVNSSPNNQFRPRVSEGEKDRKMLQMIEAYAKETGQEIDGYYNSAMSNGALGGLKNETGKAPLFHAELAVFNRDAFDAPEMAGSFTADQIESMNMAANLIRRANEDKAARAEKINNRRKTISESRNPDETTAIAKRQRLFSI